MKNISKKVHFFQLKNNLEPEIIKLSSQEKSTDKQMYG